MCGATLLLDRIQYSQHSIVFYFQSFWNSCVELCLVCKSVVKWSEIRNKFSLTQSGTSLKIKFIHCFLMLESKGRQCKHCHSLALHFVVFWAIFIVWFLRRPAFVSFIIYTTCANRWVGLNRQWCRSGRWSFTVEAVLTTLLRHKVVQTRFQKSWDTVQIVNKKGMQ